MDSIKKTIPVDNPTFNKLLNHRVIKHLISYYKLYSTLILITIFFPSIDV